MTSVYLFPGQGSQRQGMGAGLFERFPELVAQADERLGYSVAELCLHDPDRVLSRTEYTQPALYVVNVLHYLDRTVNQGDLPSVVAGHSLGEYCALFAAGAFDFDTGLELVRKRGELMSRAPRGAMAAVVKIDQEQVQGVLDDLPFRTIDVANINSRRQCVLSGEYDELLAPSVRAAFAAAGAVFVPLNVSAAFHSRCMVEVENDFAAFLSGFELAPLILPVVANVTARLYPTQGYTDLLTRQVSSPVRWYESISWLLAQGHQTFDEIGPGRVLTKLTTEIVKEPLPITEAPAPGPAGRVEVRPRTELVFMYGGQGTQYHQMGQQLYGVSPAFRTALDRCDAAHRAAGGSSLLAAIYDGSGPSKPFDDILTSHAALYSIGHSLTEALLAEQIRPDAVLGHSLGEYIAAGVAGAMSFDDGLRLVMGQARLLERDRPGGSMMSVLGPPELFRERPDLFGGLALAGVNFGRNFVVSGREDRLFELQSALDAMGMIAVRLPVRHAFHNDLLAGIRQDCLELGRTISVGTPEVPVYSSMRAGLLGAESLKRWEDYLWDVISRPVRFDELIASSFSTPGKYFFVDLSASGSFINFLRHGYGPQFRGAAVMNQFGNNETTLQNLRDQVAVA